MKNLIIASTSTLHGGSYLDYLLPVLKDKVPKQKPRADTSKVDTTKKTNPLKSSVATNQFNKTAVVQKNNATTE